MHGWTWRELLRDIPSVTIPDDHDVFHGNIWGDGGKLAEISSGFNSDAQDSGGYTITTWDAAAGTVRLENWPLWAGPNRPAPDNTPYPGWPITVDLDTLLRR